MIVPFVGMWNDYDEFDFDCCFVVVVVLTALSKILQIYHGNQY